MAFWNRDRRPVVVEEPPKSLVAGAWETVKTVLWALLIAGLFRTLLFQPFWIPSGSMKDTLLIGDFLFVNKLAYGYSYASCPSLRIGVLGVDIEADDICGWLKGDGSRRLLGHMPERGDVIVFRHPVTGSDFIKRLIGLPGDRIQMRGGLLYIDPREPGDDAAQVHDFAPVTVEPDGTFTEAYEPQGSMRSLPSCRIADGQPAPGGPCVSDRYRETLPNGVTHDILDIGPQPQDDTGVYEVPTGNLFFMGDNRDNSTDSRFPQSAGGVGFVPIEDVEGRADRVIFSSAGRSMLFFWTWRPDRFFRAIE